jgi:hypothetical protein
MCTKPINKMADNSVVVKVIVRYDDEVIGCSVMPYFTALGYTMLWERANKVEGLTITIEV